MQFNLNDIIEINLSDKGISKIKEMIEENKLPNYLLKNIRGNKYRDQAWSLFTYLNFIFFNGSQYIRNTTVTILEKS